MISTGRRHESRYGRGRNALDSVTCVTCLIGSAIAGIPELIREDETGALFETGNVRALAETLESLSG